MTPHSPGAPPGIGGPEAYYATNFIKDEQMRRAKGSGIIKDEQMRRATGLLYLTRDEQNSL